MAKNTKFKVGDKFEDIDKGQIIWRYKIEKVSPTADGVRGDKYSYFVSICYEDFDKVGDVITVTTYSVMSAHELGNERHIKKVNYWTDHPDMYDPEKRLINKYGY